MRLKTKTQAQLFRIQYRREMKGADDFIMKASYQL
jgi:hypothetical protein